MIELTGVRKAYRTLEGERVVLENCDALFPDGTSIGILGMNGAGKSTLIRLLSGVELPDVGRIRRTGRVSFPLGFGGTFRAELNGRDNVRFLARVHGVDPDEALDFVEEFAELGAYIRMPVGTYSSGMRARLAFGACLAIEFDTYLIDEVTAVGDARFRERCLEAFSTRMERADVIMVTHDVDVMRAYCDSAAVLASGRLEFYDRVDDAVQAHERRARRPSS